jgi:hypothetical protein
MAGKKKRRPISMAERVVLGGHARAEALSRARRRQIAKQGATAAAEARAGCAHPVKEKRFSQQTGKQLPGLYCRSCRRKLS